MVDAAPKFEYHECLDLTKVKIADDNERQTIDNFAFYSLVNSIKRKGVITPIGVEAMPDRTYQVIYGNRRTAASIVAGNTTIRAKVYKSLTEQQRYDMQIAENTNKEKIPAHEMAENLWEYYKFMVERLSGSEYTAAVLSSCESYFRDLPLEIKRLYSYIDHAKRVGFSEFYIRMAFRYASLHREIKELVESGELHYSFVQEVGRIPKREQVSFLENIVRGQTSDTNSNKITSKDEIAGEVTKYLNRKKKLGIFALCLVDPSEWSDEKELRREFTHATMVLENLLVYARLDSQITEAIVDGQTIKGRFSTIEDQLTTADSILSANPKYSAAVKAMNANRGTLMEQILTSAASREGDNPGFNAKYQIIPAEKLHPDSTQPRKSFPEESITELAKSIARVGLLSPILARVKGDHFEVVVGHRRRLGCLRAGLSELEIISANLSDEQVREIQYEEDIFEKVMLAERAEKLYQGYLIAKKINLKLSMAEFAREYTGLGESTVVQAMQFSSLPEVVKTMQRQGLLKYSTAAALAKLYPEKDGDREAWIKDWAVEASLLRYNASQLRDKVMALRNQMNLFDLPVADGRRRVAAKQVTEALGYLDILIEKSPKVKQRETVIELEKYRRTVIKTRNVLLAV